MTFPRDFAQPAVRRKWSRELLGPLDEAKWESLARELFAWQFARVPAYRRLCGAHGITPKNLSSWSDIPAVPQQLFKRDKLFAYGPAKPAAVYETSGTTTGQPGRQYLLATDLYREISVGGAQRIGPLSSKAQLHFLVPSPRENPHSSLSAMFGFWEKASGAKSHFWVRKGQLDFSGLREALSAAIQAGQPLAICGTAFSFVHLIDAWTDLPPLAVPRDSWLLETGGFKGRSREVSKPELYGLLAKTFTVPDYAIWNEYGMSELSSQAYAHGSNGLHGTPPWTRVLVCDPATGREVRLGQSGLVRWYDLANVDSVMSLQTLDLAERTPLGLKIIGRLPRTEPRGCSLSAEDLALSVH